MGPTSVFGSMSPRLRAGWPRVAAPSPGVPVSSRLIDAVSDPAIDEENDTRPKCQHRWDDEDRQRAGSVQSRADRPYDEPKDAQERTLARRQLPDLWLSHASSGTPCGGRSERCLFAAPETPVLQWGAPARRPRAAPVSGRETGDRLAVLSWLQPATFRQNCRLSDTSPYLCARLQLLQRDLSL
jgi:hypothetical protein